MKKLFCTLSFLVGTASLFAQSSQGIYGKFKDQKSDGPIAGVTVFLMDSSQNILASIITNLNGDFGFNIDAIGKYAIQYQMGEQKSQIITDIKIDSATTEVLNFVVNNDENVNDANVKPLSSNSTISKDEIEKMPQSNDPNAVANRSRFYKQNGVIKSATTGSPAVYYIDGQKINSSPSLIPGTVQQIDIIAK